METVIRHGQKVWVVQWCTWPNKSGTAVFENRARADEYVVEMRKIVHMIVTEPFEAQVILNDAAQTLGGEPT